MSLIVLNTYTAAGTADFSCSGGPGKQVNFVKITALGGVGAFWMTWQRRRRAVT